MLRPKYFHNKLWVVNCYWLKFKLTTEITFFIPITTTRNDFPFNICCENIVVGWWHFSTPTQHPFYTSNNKSNEVNRQISIKRGVILESGKKKSKNVKQKKRRTFLYPTFRSFDSSLLRSQYQFIWVSLFSLKPIGNKLQFLNSFLSLFSLSIYFNLTLPFWL